ncbi:MAG: GtrA family protein [Syntrophaceae bacterium]|nr:GtrA family protein [Syntrophaceae bacterium]
MSSLNQCPSVGRIKKLTDRQEFRFLIAGGVNTVFGYALFAGMVYLLSEHIHYMIIALFCNVLSITFAFLTQRTYVFKAKGHVIGEYFRFYSVYAVSSFLSLLALPLLVEFFGMNIYVAPIVIMAAAAVFSFFGHKHFSFRNKP